MSVAESSPSAELARELNAVYGLIEFARARCYPPALQVQLQGLLQSVQAKCVRDAGGAGLRS